MLVADTETLIESSSLLQSKQDRTAGLYTAATIAAALGRSARAIRRDLSATSPDGVLPVNGQKTAAWLLCSLPMALQKGLETEASRRGYSSGEHLLRHPPGKWEPPVPVSELPIATLQLAQRLQKTLAPVLEKLSRSQLDREEVVSSGIQAYAAAFGTTISRRHFERLIERTLSRDRGAEDWTRLEIFLPDRAARKKPETIILGADERWHGMLRTATLLIKEGEIDDRALSLFWDAACACLQDSISEGAAEKPLRRDLRRAIESKVPFISTRGRALERKISRAFEKWREGGGRMTTLADGRLANGRNRATELPEQFREKLIARAINSAGGLAQAWRESAREGWMPDSVCSNYDVLSARKSHVPHSIRRTLGPEVTRLAPHVIGPHHAKLQGPYIERSYENMPSGLEFQSDDCTLPVYFWEPDAAGNPRLNEKGQPILTRGQFLPWVDTRTTFIVTFQLIPEKTYDSIEILRGVSRLHDEYGLPETLYFERGIWESKLIDGSRYERTPWKDFTFGLSAFGVNVRHATTPRAKIVERVLGALQDKMNRLRGYCGRNERVDCPEETKKALQIVTAGKAHPGEFFYSMPEWVAELEKICDAYNSERQEGKLLNGQSPEAAFVALRQSPPVKLRDEHRYLLSRSRVETRIKANGVTITIGRRKFTYKGELTGARQGEKVLAWFNPEDPETICITDMVCQNPFTLRRATRVDAYNASPEQIAQAQRENHAHTKHARTLYGRLKKNFPEEFLRGRRDLVSVDPSTTRLGVQIETQRGEVKAGQERQARLTERAARTARSIGMNLRDSDITPERAAALERLNKFGVKEINPYGE